MQRIDEKKFFEELQNDIEEISHRIQQLKVYDRDRLLRNETAYNLKLQFTLLPTREKNQTFADYILDLQEWIEALGTRFEEIIYYANGVIFTVKELKNISALKTLIESVSLKLEIAQNIVPLVSQLQKTKPITSGKRFYDDLMTFLTENSVIFADILRPLNEFRKIKNSSHNESIQITEFSEKTLPVIAKVIKEFRILPSSRGQQAQMQIYHYPKNILLAIELTHCIIELTKKLAREKKSMFYGVKTFFADLVGYEETTANELASATKMFKLVTEQQDATIKPFNYSDVQSLNRGRLGSVINYYRKLLPPVLPKKFIDDEKRIIKKYAHDVAHRLRS